MEIPVFSYHNAIAASLDRDLAFLAANGYRTITASELVDALTGAAEPPDNAVALTFDDGLVSVKTVGLPLLERYDARATAFVITGLVPEGRADPGGPDDGAAVLGWDDLAALRDSGRMEIGSHGHRHNPVHVGAEQGAPPNLADYPRLYDVPVPYAEPCDGDMIRRLAGRPSRPSAPLLAAEQVIIDGEPVDAAPLAATDLQSSAGALHRHLGVERFHLSLPYGRAREAVVELARTAGFESVFWSRRDDRAANRPGDDPYRIVRQKHDFVRRLPGSGRRSRLGVLATKVKRRLTSDPWE